jgi:hypothetical protein
MTDQIFANLSSIGLELYSVGGNVTLNNLRVYPVNNATIISPLFNIHVSGASPASLWASFHIILGFLNYAGIHAPFTFIASHDNFIS